MGIFALCDINQDNIPELLCERQIDFKGYFKIYGVMNNTLFEMYSKTLEEYNANPLASEFKTFINGRWESSFTLDIKNHSKIYNVNKNLMIHGYESTLNSISVSPISITVKFESYYMEEIIDVSWFESVEYNKQIDSFPITINYKDGTSETTTYSTGTTVSDSMTNKTVSVKKFENLVNDKNIESVAFFDEIILID